MVDEAPSVIDELVQNAASYPERYVENVHSPKPSRHLAVVACMDARLQIFALLGLKPGECHIIRNAGGVITEDVVRSLVLSQRALGTREVILIHHTDCGLEKVKQGAFFDDLAAETGVRPTWALMDFTDVERDVRESLNRLRSDVFLQHRDSIRGFVFDVDSGKLREVL